VYAVVKVEIMFDGRIVSSQTACGVVPIGQKRFEFLVHACYRFVLLVEGFALLL
jgi:hypothetical protein